MAHVGGTMGKQAVDFVIKRAGVMNFIYKVFQTVAATLILAGLYTGWAIGGELINSPERLDKLERRADKTDTLIINIDKKLDQIIEKQDRDKEVKRRVDSLMSIKKGH